MFLDAIDELPTKFKALSIVVGVLGGFVMTSYRTMEEERQRRFCRTSAVDHKLM